MLLSSVTSFFHVTHAHLLHFNNPRVSLLLAMKGLVFNCFSVGGYLDCPPFLAITNNAAVNSILACHYLCD